MTDFPAVHHVALTVTDLDVSRPWYARLFGTDPVLDEQADVFYHVVWSLGNTLFGIHTHGDKTPGKDDKMSEFRTGLDHVAFGLPDRAGLEKMQQRLDELGIAHGGIKDAPYGSGLSFRDPDNNALEFFAPPG